MNDAISEAVRLLEAAKALPTADAKATVNQVIDLLMAAMSNAQGPDLEKGS